MISLSYRVMQKMALISGNIIYEKDCTKKDFTIYYKEEIIEWLRERTKHLDIFLFSAHHSVVLYF